MTLALPDVTVEQDVSTRRLGYDDLVERRTSHPAWRLLLADHAPFVLGFLSQAFLEPNVRSLPQPEIADALEDYLLARRETSPDAFPKTAEAYLSDWSDSRVGWVRRSYPPDSDIAVYEPTAASRPPRSSAVTWPGGASSAPSRGS